ncbi:MAG: vWA domain-containing protein, partial [Planctomycetota bacterium]
MVAELTAFAVFVVAGLAELLHATRCRRLSHLAFGPTRRPSTWASFSPFLRVVALCAMAWGLTTLFYAPPKVYRAQAVMEGKEEHVLIVLDVSPSMRLKDAGPDKKNSRRARALEVMESFFKRVPTEKYRMSVLAVYSSAKPVVIDTKDIDVVRSILGDLPLFQAFDVGKTKLFEGLEAAAEIAKPWNPKSTTVVLITDGDTVPAKGMPRMPASVASVLVVGVGDSMSGSFIDGGQSRQDVSTLRQI